MVEQVGQGVGEHVERERHRVGQADGHRSGDHLRGVTGGLSQVDRSAGGVETPGVEGVAEVGRDLAQDELVVRVGHTVGGLSHQGIGEVHAGGGERGRQPRRQIVGHERRPDTARHHPRGSWSTTGLDHTGKLAEGSDSPGPSASGRRRF